MTAIPSPYTVALPANPLTPINLHLAFGSVAPTDVTTLKISATLLLAAIGRTIVGTPAVTCSGLTIANIAQNATVTSFQVAGGTDMSAYPITWVATLDDESTLTRVIWLPVASQSWFWAGLDVIAKGDPGEQGPAGVAVFSPATSLYYFDGVTPAPDTSGATTCNASWAALVALAPSTGPVTVYLNPNARYNFTGGPITIPAGWNIVCNGSPLFDNLDPTTCPGIIVAPGTMLHSNPLQTTGALSATGANHIKGVTVISQFAATTPLPTTIVGIEAYFAGIIASGTGFQTMQGGADVFFEDCCAIGFNFGFVSDSNTGVNGGPGSSARPKWLRCRASNGINGFYWANSNDAGWMSKCDAHDLASYGGSGVKANTFLAFGAPITDGFGGTLLPITAYNGVSASPWSNLTSTVGTPISGGTVSLCLQYSSADPTNPINTPTSTSPLPIGSASIRNYFTPPYPGATALNLGATNRILGVWCPYGGGWAVQVPGVLPTSFYTIAMGVDGALDLTATAQAPNCATLARVAIKEGCGLSICFQGESQVEQFTGFAKEHLIYLNSSSVRLAMISGDSGGAANDANECFLFLDANANAVTLSHSAVLNYQTAIYNTAGQGFPFIVSGCKGAGGMALMQSPGQPSGGCPIVFSGCGLNWHGPIGLGANSGAVSFSGVVFPTTGADGGTLTINAQAGNAIFFDTSCQNLAQVAINSNSGGTVTTSTAAQALQNQIQAQVVAGLPTSDPVFSGILWNNAGVLCISGNFP